MKIKANDLKSCFNCRLAEAFIYHSVPFQVLNIRDVECAKYTDRDLPIRVGDNCLHWEKKG